MTYVVAGVVKNKAISSGSTRSASWHNLMWFSRAFTKVLLGPLNKLISHQLWDHTKITSLKFWVFATLPVTVPIMHLISTMNRHVLGYPIPLPERTSHKKYRPFSNAETANACTRMCSQIVCVRGY